jgi:hypothetical protein
MGTTVGGYVTANLTLADGSVVNDVVVAKINGYTPISVDQGAGVIKSKDSSRVSNVYTMNGEYYGHLVTYSVNDKGQYSLNLEPEAERHNALKNVHDGTNANIVKGRSTIYMNSADQINVVYAGNDTVFLVNNGQFGYTVYVGYNNVPTMKDATVCYLNAADKYSRVKVMVINGKETANTEFDAYLANANAAYIKVVGSTAYNVYYFYKIGETQPTEVLIPTGTNDAKLQIRGEGFYTVEITDGVASNITFVTGAPVKGHSGYRGDQVNASYAGHTLDVCTARTAVVADSIATTSMGSANKNFTNMENAKYFKAVNGVVVEAAKEDVSANSVIAVIYDMQYVKIGEVNHMVPVAVYVYLAQTAQGGDQDTDAGTINPNAKVTVTFNTGFVTNANGKLLKSGEANAVYGNSFTFVVVTGTAAPAAPVVTGNAVLNLISSNTATGAYTFELTNIDGDVTVTLN